MRTRSPSRSPVRGALRGATGRGREGRRGRGDRESRGAVRRFYNRKTHRTQLEASSSWAPHRHARREVHSYYDTFEGTLNEKPVKELKKATGPGKLLQL